MSTAKVFVPRFVVGHASITEEALNTEPAYVAIVDEDGNPNGYYIPLQFVESNSEAEMFGVTLDQSRPVRFNTVAKTEEAAQQIVDNVLAAGNRYPIVGISEAGKFVDKETGELRWGRRFKPAKREDYLSFIAAGATLWSADSASAKNPVKAQVVTDEVTD